MTRSQNRNGPRDTPVGGISGKIPPKKTMAIGESDGDQCPWFAAGPGFGGTGEGLFGETVGGKGPGGGERRKRGGRWVGARGDSGGNKA